MASESRNQYDVAAAVQLLWQQHLAAQRAAYFGHAKLQIHVGVVVAKKESVD